MTYFKNNVALRYGVKSAIIAQYLWDCLYVVKKSECHIAKSGSKEWCRCSVAHLTSIFPYLSKHQIRDAIDVLIENKVLKKKPFNASCFDHTNWYAFTEYGKSLMTQGAYNLMREDKRIINDYEIIQSFYVGKREVVVAENQKAKYKYICGYYESNEIFERIDDCFASNDYLDIMTLFCERAKEQVELCKENELSDLGILSSDMYFRISNDDDLTGKIVVENPDNLRREYRNAENQLFYVTGGNGAKPNSIGTKVYGYSFSNKKHCFIRRCDIVGIADFEKLPEWAKKDLADIKKQINRERKEVR